MHTGDTGTWNQVHDTLVTSVTRRRSKFVHEPVASVKVTTRGPVRAMKVCITMLAVGYALLFTAAVRGVRLQQVAQAGHSPRAP